MNSNFTTTRFREFGCWLLFCLSLACSVTNSLARPEPIGLDKTVTGRITDAKKQPLPGVSVVLKGTTKGTTNDADGRFQLSVPNGGAILQVSYIGYITQEVAVRNRAIVDVVLADDEKSLNEVVVVGYGSQKKSDLTGAVSTITSKDVGRLPVGGIDQALQGKAAGVRVTQSTGAPGEGVAVRVRGVGTINDNSPLFIIDGVPTKDPSSLLNPADIESMTVLKDASSASIYGARALLRAGKVLNKPTWIATAKREIDNFYPYLIQQGFLESFEVEQPGNDVKPLKTSQFSQIAYGIRPMVWAALEAYGQTQDAKYADLAGKLTSWFLGRNAASAPMYDQTSGRGYDGLGANGQVNRNAGAESTIESLWAFQRLEQYPEAVKALDSYK